MFKRISYKNIFSLMREIRHYENLLAANETYSDYDKSYSFMEAQAIRDRLKQLRISLGRYEVYNADTYQAAFYACGAYGYSTGNWHTRPSKNDYGLNYWIQTKPRHYSTSDDYEMRTWVVKHLPFDANDAFICNWHDVKNLVARAKRNGHTLADLANSEELFSSYTAIPF